LGMRDLTEPRGRKLRIRQKEDVENKKLLLGMVPKEKEKDSDRAIKSSSLIWGLDVQFLGAGGETFAITWAQFSNERRVFLTHKKLSALIRSRERLQRQAVV